MGMALVCYSRGSGNPFIQWTGSRLRGDDVWTPASAGVTGFLNFLFEIKRQEG